MNKKIAIIGAGFSGAATAIQLLTRHGQQPFEVTLINRHMNLARGVAYGTHSPSHLLNVPAGRMSLFPDREEDFLEFAHGMDSTISAASFVPRSLYGKYLHARLEQSATAVSKARLHIVTGVVTAITPQAGGALLNFADGRQLSTDRVVLAVGNYPPPDPPVADGGVFSSHNYVRDPWTADALDDIPLNQPVLLIGTGLTMMDVALELERRGFSSTLFALSRRGLLPQAHRQLPAMPHLPSPAELFSTPAGARGYLRIVRRAVAEDARQGRDWRDVIGALRAVTPSLWQALNQSERRRFLRHVQPYWDTHRHRTAPASAARFAKLLSASTLVIRAGRLVELAPTRTGVRALWRPRSQDRSMQWEVAAVVNCTGPQTDLSKLPDPLIRSLLAQELITPDPLGLGLETDAVGALFDNAGQPSRVLYYTGPLLKARDWECTAVPELRLAALKLADHLAATLGDYGYYPYNWPPRFFDI